MRPNLSEHQKDAIKKLADYWAEIENKTHLGQFHKSLQDCKGCKTIEHRKEHLYENELIYVTQMIGYGNILKMVNYYIQMESENV